MHTIMNHNTAPMKPLTITACTSTTIPANNQPFRFLDLPAELRCQIYEYFVVVGKIFYTPDLDSVRNEKRFNDWKMYPTPELTLLRVCKQVRNEAEEIYLAKNLFVLPDFLGYRQSVQQGNKTDGHVIFAERKMFSVAAQKNVKNISMSFNPRSPAPRGNGHDGWRVMDEFDPSMRWDSLTPQRRLEYAHEDATQSLTAFWNSDVYWAERFFTPAQIKYLEVDLTNAFCLIGCCRPMDECIGELIFVLEPSHVVFRGIRDEDEEDRIMEQIEAYFAAANEDEDKEPLSIEQLETKFNIKFDPEVDVWAEWKMEKGGVIDEHQA